MNLVLRYDELCKKKLNITPPAPLLGTKFYAIERPDPKAPIGSLFLDTNTHEAYVRTGNGWVKITSQWVDRRSL